jgi:hypothetical protein
MGGAPEHHSGTALRRCLDASHLNEAAVDVTFDISPDGAVENLAPLLWMEGTPVTGQAQACLAAVFRLIQYPPSDGGPCRVRRRVDTFLAP